jgi:hypothetical protein
MALPYDIPEKLIEGKEDFYILNKLTKIGIGKGGFSQETLAEYARCCTPENIHGACEDYRAGIGIDMDMDTADFEAGRRIECPAAIYWGALSHTDRLPSRHIPENITKCNRQPLGLSALRAVAAAVAGLRGCNWLDCKPLPAHPDGGQHEGHSLRRSQDQGLARCQLHRDRVFG